MARRFTAAALACIGLIACSRAGQIQQEQKKIASNGAESVLVQVLMKDGDLEVTSHRGEPLLDAQFAYNVQAWRPNISYVLDAGSGKLTVRQPTRHRWMMGDSHNWWSLDLMQGPFIDLKVNHKNGPTQLDLGGLRLNSVNAQFEEGDWDLSINKAQSNLAKVEVASQQGKGHLELSGPFTQLRLVEDPPRAGRGHGPSQWGLFDSL